jgi:hypothetical protein
MISIAWYWFVLVVLGLLFGGFQIGSIVEYKKGYNFADLENDLINSLESQAAAEGKTVLAAERSQVSRIVAGARRLEFWKKH